MSDKDGTKPPPATSPSRAPDRSESRRARQAKALRANLLRRKAQSRAREDEADTAGESSSSDDKIG